MSEPTPPFHVRAIAPYAARNGTEVSLAVNEVYEVLATDGKGIWWQSKGPNGNVGWFPASYTEVIKNSPPSQQLPPPPVEQPTYQAQNDYAQQNSFTQSPSQGSIQPSTSQNSIPIQAELSNQSNGSNILSEVPPSATPREERGGPFQTYLRLHVVEAKGLKGEQSKTSPSTFIIRRNPRDDGSGEPIFATKPLKKTINPYVNELFHLQVKDAENEIFCVRFFNGDKPVMKNCLGEVSFPLRAAARDFDSPRGKYAMFQLSSVQIKEKKGRVRYGADQGEVKIFIEYVDTRQTEGPKNFQHVSHVGWSDGQFNINNIPDEWKKIFKSFGIKKGELSKMTDSQRNEVFSHVNDYAQQHSQLPPEPAYQQTQQQLPPPPVINRQPQSHQPLPPPVQGGGRGPPPPPPPPGQQQNSTPVQGGGRGPPPPPPGQQQNSLPPPSSSGPLGQIASGSFKLRPVSQAVNELPPPQQGGGDLASSLMQAMASIRQDIAGKNEGEWSDDDWSD